LNINKFIKDTLKPLGAPVEFQKYSGDQSTYITFFCYNELGEVYAENKEVITGYYLQVDLWSKGDYMELADNIKTAMENAGFRRTSSIDLYEKDTEIYHKAIRFNYLI
jgi:hypothetical protein